MSELGEIFSFFYIYTVTGAGQRLLTATSPLAQCARPQPNTCGQTGAEGFMCSFFFFFGHRSCLMLFYVSFPAFSHWSIDLSGIT